MSHMFRRKMDTLDDSENNAKISDSAYSNSCSNSQSRRSHSSKSTHSGSNSSASSGYGGKPSTSGCGSTITSKPPEKRSIKKEPKKKRTKVKSLKSKLKAAKIQPQTKSVAPEPVKEFKVPKREFIDVTMRSAPSGSRAAKGVESMDISSTAGTSQEKIGTENKELAKVTSLATSRTSNLNVSDNFSCVISMHDGIVMYATSSVTSVLGYPKEMLTGRSFLDFVHERDRTVFASQISSGLALPKNCNGMPIKAVTQINTTTSVVCRLRQYRALTSGFAVKEKPTSFLPFELKLSFKKINNLGEHCVYLVVQATPFYAAYHTPSEIIPRAVPFIIRHSANGILEFLDQEAVPYLGYLPHELRDKSALQLYHPHDLDYLQRVYETAVKEGSVPRGAPYRMMAQNGDYIKLETEWTSFINPWSKKLEFIIGKHHVIEGPRNPDVYFPPSPATMLKLSDDDKAKTHCMRENIVRIMNEVLTKPAEMARQQIKKRCEDIAAFMESLIEETPKPNEDLRMDLYDIDNSYYDRDSIMLGGISPHHDYNDGESNTDAPPTYNQLNYNDNLQRYFDCYRAYIFEERKSKAGESIRAVTDRVDHSGNPVPPFSRYGRSGGEGSSKRSRSNVSFGSSSYYSNYVPVRLTEAMLRKHNAEMEKDLIRQNRETRFCSRSEREKTIVENRQKKKEHLARCNAAFQPTSACLNPPLSQHTNEDIYNVPHGLKRTTKTSEAEAGAHKHPCMLPRVHRRWATTTKTVTSAPTSTYITTASVEATWTSSRKSNDMDAFLIGANIPQPLHLHVPQHLPLRVPQCVPLRVPQPGTRRVSQPGHLRVPTPRPQHVSHPVPLNIPQPASLHGSQPASLHGPQPASLHGPQPATLHGPQPASLHIPQPASLNGPQPASLHDPQPASLHGPQPASLHGPQPASLHGPQPASLHGPQPASLHGPQPASLHGPQPVSLHGPQPASLHIPQPASLQGPQPASLHGPEPGSPHGPQPASLHGPQPASLHGPQPASLHGPQPASLHGPEPGSPHGPQPASLHGPQPASLHIPRPLQLHSAISGVPAILPMYYTAAMRRRQTSTSRSSTRPGVSNQPAPMMMYGRPVYGPQLNYRPVNPHAAYDMRQGYINQGQAFASSINPLLLTNRNFTELKPKQNNGNFARVWRQKRKSDLQARFMKQRCGGSSSSAENSNGSTVAMGDGRRSRSKRNSNKGDKSDGDSSFYSLYSSLFKTESGSAEDSDNRRSDNDAQWARPWSRFSQTDDWYGQKKPVVSVQRRTKDPPWMDQVFMTPDLKYKYQVPHKNLEEVLSSDKERLKKMEQPSLVNDQLAQLYTDLQLEGITARLTLEESVASSSSSDEDNVATTKKNKYSSKRRQETKVDHSKMVLIYEEEAPFPPPGDAPCAPSLYNYV